MIKNYKLWSRKRESRFCICQVLSENTSFQPRALLADLNYICEVWFSERIRVWLISVFMGWIRVKLQLETSCESWNRPGTAAAKYLLSEALANGQMAIFVAAQISQKFRVLLLFSHQIWRWLSFVSRIKASEEELENTGYIPLKFLN